MKDYLDGELAAGKIRTSTSEARSPAFFVGKQDGGKRLVVDFRKLNEITIKDRTPLPRQEDLIDKLKHAKVFTQLDLRWGYNNVRIKEGEEYKTAFGTKYGHFEYLVMPFGLTNAPAAFQRFMNDIFRDLLDVTVIVYLDDILIFSEDPTKHEEHVKEVLKRLKANQLFCKPSKCHFSVTTVTYLGLVITPQGISMDEKKVEAVNKWPKPTKVKEVQAFLGLANFYRRFVKDFSSIVKPLTTLTKKDHPWTWGNKEQLAFDTLKQKMSEKPVLIHPDPEKPYFLETDASGVAMGAVLSQRDKDGRLHPVAFMSKGFTGAEINYDTHDKELLAILKAFEEWRIHLEDTKDPVTVLTDHRNLEYWKKAVTFNRRHQRWHLLMAAYNFIIQYRPGKQSEKPDALSRRADHKDVPSEPQVMIPGSTFRGFTGHIDDPDLPWQDRLKHATRADPSLDLIMEFFDNQEDVPMSLAKKFKEYEMRHGLLHYQGKTVVPDSEALRLEIMQAHHSLPEAGHQGQARTLELVSRTYYWPGMKADINRFVNACDICQRTKPKSTAIPLQPLAPPGQPFEEITYDLIVKLPISNGFDSILVVVDRFSKTSHFIPCREAMSAPELAELYVHNVWKLHGTPKSVISDRGTTFGSKFLRALYKRLGVEPKFSTAYHPQTDGQTERVNQWLEQYLRAYVSHRQTDWAKWLPLAEFCHNNSINRATGQTPFRLLYGMNPRLTIGGPESDNPEANSRISELAKAREDALASLEMTQQQYARDSSHYKLPGFEVGSKVWLSSKNITTARPSKKLEHKRFGPFLVSEVVSPVAFRLKLPKSMRIHDVFHADLLTPVTDPVVPSAPPPEPEIVDGEERFEVETILDSRVKGRGLQYLVRWAGYGKEDDTWEWRSALAGSADEAVAEFHEAHPEAPSLHQRRP